MNTYLNLAEQVLGAIRTPMTAREILDRAYAAGMVPPELFGKTQHKTLGARLSEDILLRRDRSDFYRTAPGRYFLRRFLSDESVPEKYRIPFSARRRQRELNRGLRTLAFDRSALARANTDGEHWIRLLREHCFHYVERLSERGPRDLVLWSFVLVMRDNHVLTYRHGRYKEDRDAFLLKRSVGFFSPVTDLDFDLFDGGDRGVVNGGLKAVLIDLDIPLSGREDELRSQTKLETVVASTPDDDAEDVLAVVRFECPDWFEPVGRRLAINDLQWMNMASPPNHLEDFDPWSRRVLALAHALS